MKLSKLSENIRRAVLFAAAVMMLASSVTPAFAQNAPEATPPVEATAAETEAQAAKSKELITIATYNAFLDLSAGTVVNDVRKIVNDSGANVITIQENQHNNRRHEIIKRLTCDTCRYRAFASNGWGKEEYIILWNRNDFRLVRHGTYRTTSAFREHGSSFPPLYLNWVRLESRKNPGKHFYVGTNHLPALIDRDNDGRPNSGQLPERVKKYNAHMAAVNDKIRKWKKLNPGDAIFITGDYNVCYRKDHVVKDEVFPTKKFSYVGGKSNWEESNNYPGRHTKLGTFKPWTADQPKYRLIDYIFSVPNRSGVEFRDTGIIHKGMNSDHNAVYARYKF